MGLMSIQKMMCSKWYDRFCMLQVRSDHHTKAILTQDVLLYNISYYTDLSSC
jgi:hypothetical protein